MRTPPPEPSAQPSYQRGGGGGGGGYQHVGHDEPAWMREEGLGTTGRMEPLPAGPTLGAIPGEATPLRGSAPSTAPSSVGRPGRVAVVPGGMYRPYMSTKDVHRGCCLSLFVGVNAVTVLSALSVAVAEILSIIYHRLSPQAVAIRCYGVGLAFLIVFTEMGWTQAVRDTPLLQNWVSRGLIYTFVGLLALEQQAEKTASIDAVNFYILGAGVGLVALGILYFVMGVLCLKRVRDRRAAAYRIARSQAELEEALRRHTDMDKPPMETQAAHGPSYSSVVI